MKVKSCFLVLVASLILINFSMPVFAKEINLYDQPKADAKVVSTADLAVGIIPIYTPKEGGWVKVADPRNGNVGWVKSSDIGSSGLIQSSFSYTEGANNGDKKTSSYQVIQSGSGPSFLTPEQAKAIAERAQMQQQVINQTINKSVQDVMRNMNELFRDFPIVVPVVIYPAQKNPGTYPAPNPPPPTLQQNTNTNNTNTDTKK